VGLLSISVTRVLGSALLVQEGGLGRRRRLRGEAGREVQRQAQGPRSTPSRLRSKFAQAGSRLVSARRARLHLRSDDGLVRHTRSFPGWLDAWLPVAEGIFDGGGPGFVCHEGEGAAFLWLRGQSELVGGAMMELQRPKFVGQHRSSRVVAPPPDRHDSALNR